MLKIIESDKLKPKIKIDKKSDKFKLKIKIDKKI
jgi:hypothetical protein